MKHRVTRVTVGQLTKMLMALYACVGVIFLPFFALTTMVDPDLRGFGIVFTLFLPFVYAVIGAVSGAIGAVLYNWIAGWLGGIEIELDEPGSAPGAP